MRIGDRDFGGVGVFAARDADRFLGGGLAVLDQPARDALQAYRADPRLAPPAGSRQTTRSPSNRKTCCTPLTAEACA